MAPYRGLKMSMMVFALRLEKTKLRREKEKKDNSRKSSSLYTYVVPSHLGKRKGSRGKHVTTWARAVTINLIYYFYIKI
jgi:hypothetical protein